MNGTYIAAKIMQSEDSTASISFGLLKYGTVKMFFVSDFHSKTCASWVITRVKSAAVLAVSTLPDI